MPARARSSGAPASAAASQGRVDGRLRRSWFACRRWSRKLSQSCAPHRPLVAAIDTQAARSAGSARASRRWVSAKRSSRPEPRNSRGEGGPVRARNARCAARRHPRPAHRAARLRRLACAADLGRDDATAQVRRQQTQPSICAGCSSGKRSAMKAPSEMPPSHSAPAARAGGRTTSSPGGASQLRSLRCASSGAASISSARQARARATREVEARRRQSRRAADMPPAATRRSRHRRPAGPHAGNCVCIYMSAPSQAAPNRPRGASSAANNSASRVPAPPWCPAH